MITKKCISKGWYIMRVITKDEFMIEANKLLTDIKDKAVFIYPTDTIYGIGCNALNSKSVERIREAKKRPKAPFSIIAPSKEWIIRNCEVSSEAEEWLEKLPGPYTLILKLKNKNCVAPEVVSGADSMGIRIPKHWVSRIAAELEAPIVTTSVNEAGKVFMTSLENLDPQIRSKVDFIIDEGEKKGRPSNVVFLDDKEVTIRDRQKGEHYPESKKI